MLVVKHPRNCLTWHCMLMTGCCCHDMSQQMVRHGERLTFSRAKFQSVQDEAQEATDILWHAGTPCSIRTGIPLEQIALWGEIVMLCIVFAGANGRDMVILGSTK